MIEYLIEEIQVAFAAGYYAKEKEIDKLKPDRPGDEE
jgi:hypothetical protein